MYRTGTALNRFNLQAAATTRRILTAVVLAQSWDAYSGSTNAQQNGAAYAQQQQQADGARSIEQQPHRFVLSASNFATHFAMHNNMHSMLEFVEDLFAVRIPKFITFAVIVSFSLVIAKILPLIFDEILRRFRTPENYRAGFWLFLQGLIVVFGIWLGLAAVGIDFFGILFTFGVITIGITQAIGAPLGNIFSGFMVQTEGYVRRGQDITVEGVRGIVVDIGLSSVTIKRIDANILSVIPNNHFSQVRVDINLPDDGTSNVLRTESVAIGPMAVSSSSSSTSAYALHKTKNR